MFQTAYKGITNLTRKIPYIGGFCRFWFIPVEEVETIPPIDPLTQYLTAEPVLVTDKVWRGPVPVPEKTLGFLETQQNGTAGSYFKQSIQGTSPGDYPQHRVNLDNMTYAKFICVGKLRAGGFYLLVGSIDSPLDFDQEFTSGANGSNDNAGTKLAFTGESICRALVMPSFDGDQSGGVDPGGGGGGTGGANQTEIIYINNESTKDIAWTPARLAAFGVFPEVECWILDPGTGEYSLSAFQPFIDAPPPAAFTLLSYDFGGNVTGFIVIK